MPSIFTAPTFFTMPDPRALCRLYTVSLTVSLLLFRLIPAHGQVLVIHYTDGSSTSLAFHDILKSEPYGTELRFTLQNDSLLAVPTSELSHIDFGGVSTGLKPGSRCVRPELTVAPNPASTAVRIQLDGGGLGPLRVEILDAAGVVVHSLEGAPGGEGGAGLLWGLTDRTGGRVPPGPYFCRATTDKVTLVKALVVQ